MKSFRAFYLSENNDDGGLRDSGWEFFTKRLESDRAKKEGIPPPKTIKSPKIVLPREGSLVRNYDLDGYIDHTGELIFTSREVPWGDTSGNNEEDERSGPRPPDKILRKNGKAYVVYYYHDGTPMGIDEVKGD